MDWLPIESAPKDGTPVLLFIPGVDRGRDGCEVGQRWGDDESSCWWSNGGPNGGLELAEADEPLFWMPLPPPPQAAKD